MKILKKVLLYLATGIVAITIGLIASVFLFKDRIINEFIREANKSLNTPIKIGKIDISAFTDFPNMAIVFRDVYIEDSHPGTSPLATAKSVSFYLNPIEVWSGRYSIRGLQINESETFLKINAAGKSNYVILKPQQKQSEQGNITLDLKNVVLKKSKVSYHDQQIKQHHTFESESLVASLLVENEVYHITTQGDITVGQIGVRQNKFLENKSFGITSTLHYNDKLKSILIDPSAIELNASEFEVKGEYFFKDLSFVNLTASGQQTTIQTLLALLPENTADNLRKYESEGEVYFDLKLKGEWSENKMPLFSIGFGCRNATLLYPPTQTKIENANLEGSYASTSAGRFEQGELFLKNITGELNGEKFNANLSVQNFNDPYVEFDFTGKLDAASVNNFYPITDVTDLSGALDASISFAGQLALLKNKATAQKAKANGRVELLDINFRYGPRKVDFKNLNGSLQFTNNDLALSNVKGQLGKSDFLLNGFFKNIITFLLFEDQPIGIETDLKSNHLDLDQLFQYGFGEQQSSEFNFSISPNIHLNFNCDVKSLSYKRFHPSNIKGDLLVKNQMAVSRNISLTGMGGMITINGIVDAKNRKAIDLVSSFKLEGVNADSVFFVFENFYQDFIQDKHLKGKVYAEVTTEMTLNEKLKLFSETLIADISATIKNGELNDFEPLKKLNRYLDDEGLGRLRFADLKNEIHIENKTIYIPLMEIKSNVTAIQLNGTHTFDQRIDYRVIAPLQNKKKIDPDEAFGALEETTGGKPKLYLKITGTTENYTIAYDREAVKKKIAGDLKKEVQELKDAFKTRGKKKKKELELAKDDYFDWNDNQLP